MSNRGGRARLIGAGFAIALCAGINSARADDAADDAVDDTVSTSADSASDDDARSVPELDPRAAGLALSVLGGSLFVLFGRRKRHSSAAV